MADNERVLASLQDPGRPVPPAVLRRRVVRLVAAVAVTTGALAPAGAAVAKPTFIPAAKAAAIIQPAVVYLEVNWEAWVRDKISGTLVDPQSVSLVTRCTGFAVSNDGYIATAGRCVDPGPEGVASDVFAVVADRQVKAGLITAAQKETVVTGLLATGDIGGANLGEPAGRQVYAQRAVARPGLTSGEATPAEVVSFQPASTGDVGLVKVEKSNQPMVTLADAPDVGTDVLEIGFPAAAEAGDPTLEPVAKEGKVSRKAEEDDDAAYLETTTATTQGMIGGPVANLNGEVVGMVSRDPSGARSGDASAVGATASTGTPGAGVAASAAPGANRVAAASVIAKELAKAGVSNQLGKIDRDFRGGLDDFYAGRYTAAIEKFDQVLAIVPSHAQAEDFRQEAIGLRTSEGDPAGADLREPEVFGGGALVVVLLAAVVVLLVLRYRRRNLAAAASSTAVATADTKQADANRVDANRADTSRTTLTYCSNCGQGAAPGTAACATCGNQLD